MTPTEAHSLREFIQRVRQDHKPYLFWPFIQSLNPFNEISVICHLIQIAAGGISHNICPTVAEFYGEATEER